MTIKQEISESLKRAIRNLAQADGIQDAKLPDPIVESPKQRKYGDFSTNISFLLAKRWKSSPIKIANKILQNISLDKDIVDKVEIAEPGFINFVISKKRLYRVLEEIERRDWEYGCSKIGEGKRVLIEFVSANPTGPLHVGHGRGAVVGDVLANLFQAIGYEVSREYYINDIGKQMNLLGESVKMSYLNLLGKKTSSPSAYKGKYINELAEKLVKLQGERWVDHDCIFFANFASELILKEIKKVLLNFGVKFDRWVSEKELYEAGEVKKVVDILHDKGYTYERGEATWLNTTCFGDEKDRVLIRKNGAPTYFTGDIAYHKDKFDRGYDLLIDIMGADHHGYVNRIKSVCCALGYPKETLVILLYQLVNLYRDGVQIPMSTREGEFVTLEEVIDEVGKDAARFFFIMRKLDTQLDFDLKLAKEKSADNPVYYIQYMHARICSILRHAEEKGMRCEEEEVEFKELTLPEELELIMKLAIFPDELISSVKLFEPYILILYLMELAPLFHSYYNHHRIVSSNKSLSMARLKLVNSTRIVVRNALNLLGISAPKQM
jgi:arginyl-tRNA synthetase